MPLYPKEFIQTTLLGEYRDIIHTHKYFYIGFGLVCIGIEFVGKCLDTAVQDWQKSGLSEKHFKAAIEQTMSGYTPYSDLLYKNLRSGFAHGLLPGPQIGLTHSEESLKYGTSHLSKDSNGAVTVVIESFYNDFGAACRDLLQRQFPATDKMSKPLLAIPSDPVAKPGAAGSAINARTTPY